MKNLWRNLYFLRLRFLKYIFFMVSFVSFAFPASADLIVFAAPKTQDPYYLALQAPLLEFYANFVKASKEIDNVLILVDEANYKLYAQKIPPKHLLKYPMEDIWIRDFAYVNAKKPLLFRYTKEGQGGGVQGEKEALFVQKGLKNFLNWAQIDYKTTILQNDGGNFVDNGSDAVILSTKFLQDNQLTLEEAKKQLKNLTGFSYISFIQADNETDLLQHADGILFFATERDLFINFYEEDKAYTTSIIETLKKDIEGVRIHPILWAYQAGKVYDKRFSSACGIYTNALSTDNAVYLPQFGLAEDKRVLLEVQKIVQSKKVVPIDVSAVCLMGGGLRCLSFLAKGLEAQRLLFLQKIIPLTS